MHIHLTSQHVTYLGLSDKYPMIFLTGEIAFPLHSAIVLAAGLIQYDTHPFPRGKEGGTNIGNSATLTLPYHLHYRPDLEDKKEETRGQETVSHYKLVFLPPFYSFSSFLVSVLEKYPTFGGLPLSTVPVLLILLISGLVSWKILEIQIGQSENKEKEMWEVIVKKVGCQWVRLLNTRSVLFKCQASSDMLYFYILFLVKKTLLRKSMYDKFPI